MVKVILIILMLIIISCGESSTKPDKVYRNYFPVLSDTTEKVNDVVITNNIIHIYGEGLIPGRGKLTITIIDINGDTVYSSDYYGIGAVVDMDIELAKPLTESGYIVKLTQGKNVITGIATVGGDTALNQ